MLAIERWDGDKSLDLHYLLSLAPLLQPFPDGADYHSHLHNNHLDVRPIAGPMAKSCNFWHMAQTQMRFVSFWALMCGAPVAGGVLTIIPDAADYYAFAPTSVDNHIAHRPTIPILTARLPPQPSFLSMRLPRRTNSSVCPSSRHPPVLPLQSHTTTDELPLKPPSSSTAPSKRAVREEPAGGQIFDFEEGAGGVSKKSTPRS